MWNEQLASLVGDYSTGVLSVVEPAGYPTSVRCKPRRNADRQVFTFPDPPPVAASWRGVACLLFHMHDQRLEGLRQMVIKGELVSEEGVLTLHVRDFVTANGRSDTDQLPHAGRPLHMLQFWLLGRRKAREYLAKRGTPWPPIPYDKIERALKEESA